MTKKNKKRLAVDIDIEMHNDLKMIGIRRNTNISNIVIQLISARIELEKKLLPE